LSDQAVEAIVVWKFGLRNLGLLFTLAWLITPPAALRAQDEQPSVADAARQARKDKDKEKDKAAAKAKPVITEDSLASGNGAATMPSKLVAPDLSAKQGGSDNPWTKLHASEVAIDRLASLDRAQLGQLVLKNADDFPGRRDWETKLFSAKVSYVARSRQLIEAMKQVLVDMDTLQTEGHGKIESDDPRAQELAGRAAQIVKLTNSTETNFQAVMAEGQTLQRQAGPR
jgi:hypothetical protein